jgi:hypothetical protein
MMVFDVVDSDEADETISASRSFLNRAIKNFQGVVAR